LPRSPPKIDAETVSLLGSSLSNAPFCSSFATFQAKLNSEFASAGGCEASMRPTQLSLSLDQGYSLPRSCNFEVALHTNSLLRPGTSSEKNRGKWQQFACAEFDDAQRRANGRK
jgi:hypothetical protein